MGGYGPPGRETGGGFCGVWFAFLLLIPLILSGCVTALPEYPKIVLADGYLVECGKPYTAAEIKAGVKHDCQYYGNSRARVFHDLGGQPIKEEKP